jgi:predicted transcriptional regulator
LGEGSLNSLLRARDDNLLLEIKKGNNNSHRGSLDIIADILEASFSETKKTYLMYQCNMSFKQLKYYLEFLLRKELLYAVSKDANSDFDFFKITDKGKEFLKVYKGLKALVK